jgi:hypothetical protein
MRRIIALEVALVLDRIALDDEECDGLVVLQPSIEGDVLALLLFELRALLLLGDGIPERLF